jgi:hypothetical protein
MKVNTSSTGPTRKLLMFQVEKIKKAKLLLSGRNTQVPIRDGRLSILTKLKDHKRRDLTRNSDSTATDHSTSSLDFQ